MPVASSDKFQEQSLVTGDRPAWEELYRTWFRKLFNYGRRFSPNEGLIEDVIQDIFLTLWQQGNMGIRSLGSYLFTSFRSEEHPSELQSLMRRPYAVSCVRHTYI